MTILIFSFLISFIAIIVIFGRKLALIQDQNINTKEKEYNEQQNKHPIL